MTGAIPQLFLAATVRERPAPPPKPKPRPWLSLQNETLWTAVGTMDRY
jgi:hypothetical protein